MDGPPAGLEPLPYPGSHPEPRSTRPPDRPPPLRPDRTAIAQRNSGGGGSRRSSADDERQGRRKATRREDHSAVPSPQLLRRLPVGGDESTVAFVELAPNLPRGSVNEGCVRMFSPSPPFARRLPLRSRGRHGLRRSGSHSPEAMQKLRLVQKNEVVKRPAVCDDDHRPDRIPRSR